jgi:hypothetical protein
LCLAKNAVAAQLPGTREMTLADVAGVLGRQRRNAAGAPREGKFELLVATIIQEAGYRIRRGAAENFGSDIIGVAPNGTRLAVQCELLHNAPNDVLVTSMHEVLRSSNINRATGVLATNRYLTPRVRDVVARPSIALLDRREALLGGGLTPAHVVVLDRDTLLRSGPWVQQLLHSIEWRRPVPPRTQP